MVSNPDLVFRVEGALGRITLNRPQALNALTLEMCEALKEQLAAWAEDAKITAVAIDAVPGRAFCAGGDIRIVSQWGRDGDPRALQFFATEYSLNALISRFPKPYVALIDGICMGGGVGISIHGSHRIVTENALFAMPEAAIGFFTDVGGSYFLSRMPGATGTYLGLTGARIRAADMLFTGAATHFIPSTELPRLTARLADGEDTDTAIATLAGDAGAPPLQRYRSRIDAAFASGSVEVIVASLGDSEFERDAKKRIATGSPTSLKLIHRQLEEGLARDLDACLEMEFQIVGHVLKGHDFAEGVRALLIDRDNVPRWQPDRLDLVSEVELARHFLPSQYALGL
jgi:enoyl-CoA hydratase